MSQELKTFKGMCLQPDSVIINVAYLLGACRALEMSDDQGLAILGSEVLGVTQEYLEAAARNLGSSESEKVQ
ncbi:hypothetical protein ACQUWL_20280 [Serratia marcescens]|uniref:hypothetical protein n=1 Tax=Serratia marcescens TaxID=615 RepID=UPI003D16B968